VRWLLVELAIGAIVLSCWVSVLIDLHELPWYNRFAYWSLTLGIVALGSFYFGEVAIFPLLEQ
jgi:hypothetical protein